MEGTYHYQQTEMLPLNVYTSHDFGVTDFLYETNQFVDPVFDSFHHDEHTSIVLGDCLNDNQLFPPYPAMELFDFDVTKSDHLANIEFLKDQLVEGVQEEDMIDGEDSSGGNTTSTSKKNKTSTTKADRSRTLVSERKRRGRMKDKLYTLRSLVPNISKMDKASIVGDAVSYMQDLQMQARKLKAEIADLESTAGSGDIYKGKTDYISSSNLNVTSFYPVIKNIFKMEVVSVEEREFYVKIESNKGKGIGASLYKAIESLTSFAVKSSNLAVCGENYVLMFTLHILEQEMDISLSNVKLWITSAFLNQGFEFETLPFC